MKQWLKYFDDKELNYVLNTLKSKYINNSIEPCPNNVFKAFKLCPVNDLKVIILGQDPYPQKGKATGLAFANCSEVADNNLSPSLQVLIKSFLSDTIDYEEHYVNPNLEYLAKQGILLLNTALTVEVDKPGSHALLWRNFIKQLLKNLSDYFPGLIYICLGEQAKSFVPYINTNFNYILYEKHPAYYARNNKTMPNTVFKTASMIVKSNNNINLYWYE